jgi:hypothetical protein
MDIAITQGRVTVNPIPAADPEAPAGSVAGYMLNIQDGDTGITVRVSMEHHNAAALGQVLKQHTDEHPVWRTDGKPDIAVVQSIPHGVPEPPA